MGYDPEGTFALTAIIIGTLIGAIVGGSVSALSAGFQFGVGIKDGEFYYKSGFAVLFGYDFYIRIKFA